MVLLLIAPKVNEMKAYIILIKVLRDKKLSLVKWKDKEKVVTLDAIYN